MRQKTEPLIYDDLPDEAKFIEKLRREHLLGCRLFVALIPRKSTAGKPYYVRRYVLRRPTPSPSKLATPYSAAQFHIRRDGKIERIDLIDLPTGIVIERALRVTLNNRLEEILV